MKSQTRRAVAYIAARLISGRNSGSVYDYSISSHVSFSATISDNRISAYDYDQSCHIGGSLPNLYHYGNSAHLSLTIAGTHFKGYDYDTSSHYSGKINGRSISIIHFDPLPPEHLTFRPDVGTHTF